MSADAAACLRCFALVSVLALAGCAAALPRPDGAAPATGGTDQLIAAALRSWAIERNAPQALSLAERAAAAAPNRPDIALLHLRLCGETPRCESQSLEARLKKLAPGNAAAWLSVLARAQTGRDTPVEEQVLAAMGRAQQFDLYWTTLLWRATTALHASVPPRGGTEAATPLTRALNGATGWLSALLFPAFKPLSTLCSAEHLRNATRRANCERIAQTLQRGDSYAAEGLGLGIAQRLAPPGSAAAAQIEQRIKTLGYQNQTAGAVMASQLERDKFSGEMIELMKKLPREQDVALAILRWAGQPLTP